MILLRTYPKTLSGGILRLRSGCLHVSFGIGSKGSSDFRPLLRFLATQMAYSTGMAS